MQNHRILEQKCPPPKLKLISYCAIANGGGFWKSQISQFWSYRRRKVPRVPQPSRTVSPKPKSCRILTLQSARFQGCSFFGVKSYLAAPKCQVTKSLPPFSPFLHYATYAALVPFILLHGSLFFLFCFFFFSHSRTIYHWGRASEAYDLL